MRDKRLDSLRGLFLLIMTIDHFGAPLRKITHEAFGYISAAEGFVFLSGYFFALIHTKYIKTPKILIHQSMTRAWLVYKYYFITIIILFLLYLNIPAYHEAWKGWLFPNQSNPYYFTLYEMLLLHQPKYMDILPLYIIFILFSPFVLIQINKGNFIFIFITTIGIWTIGQFFNFMEEIIRLLQLGTNPGYFNIFAWQLIWIIGIYFGYAKALNIKIRLPKNGTFFYIVVISTTVFLLYRHEILEFGYHFILSLIEKDDLEVLRLLNFLLMVYLVWVILGKIPPSKGIPWLQFIGCYSIQVFSFHIFLIYLLKPIWLQVDKTDYVISITFVSLVVASLSIPAYIANKTGYGHSKVDPTDKC
jgi:hypothetical protein